MLKIFYDMEPFFNNHARRINVREYARLRSITPPTASKLLSEMHNEGLLEREKERNYIFYLANKKNPLFANLSQLYFMTEKKMKEKEPVRSAAVIIGSFSKSELAQIEKRFQPENIIKVDG